MTVANLVVIHQLNFLDHKDKSKNAFNQLFDINSIIHTAHLSFVDTSVQFLQWCAPCSVHPCVCPPLSWRYAPRLPAGNRYGCLSWYRRACRYPARSARCACWFSASGRHPGGRASQPSSSRLSNPDGDSLHPMYEPFDFHGKFLERLPFKTYGFHNNPILCWYFKFIPSGETVTRGAGITAHGRI